MNPDLQEGYGEIMARNRFRGTGRTTRIIQNLLEHVASIPRDKGYRLGIFVVNDARHWYWVKNIFAQQRGFHSMHNQKREIYFDFGTVLVVGRDNLDRIRGTRGPIAQDHTIWEDPRPVPELLYLMQDRIINFN